MGSAKVYLENNTDSSADLVLYHMSANYGTSGISGTAVPPGGKIGPLHVSWNAATPGDFWYASIAVSGGAQPGIYVSHVPDDLLLPYWKECMLIGEFGLKDDGSSPIFTVDWNNFSINLKSGSCGAGMLATGPYSPVQHIFVLMLENHSFDNIFAFSGIDGIAHATTADSNWYDNTEYFVSDAATPTGMPTDPGHEFADVINQLCGYETSYTPPTYPPITLSGFAASYATSVSEKTGTPTGAEIGDIMACFNTAQQLPNIYKLATSYVICDDWFSSLPGPTWPNRFYLHGASSAYWNGSGYESLDDSPSSGQVVKWESVDGFTYQAGSIFDSLNKANIPWRIYHDDTLNMAGSIPQVSAIKGISLADVLDVKGIGALAGDLQSGYPYRYTFIEPNYGSIADNTYKGGSSQHPEDDVSGGENLIATVFNAITSSPLWPNSMLIITYDEHGGFYDSVAPIGTVPPDASDQPGPNGFVFNQLGVRVPAVIASPLVTPGVCHTVFDHSSVLATVERLFGLQPLTARDKAANDFIHLLAQGEASPGPAPRLETGRTAVRAAPARAEELAARAATPIPRSGNVQGFLAAARKADIELADGAAVLTSTQAIQTVGEAEAYLEDVMARVWKRRAAHEAAVRARATQPGAKTREDGDRG